MEKRIKRPTRIRPGPIPARKSLMTDSSVMKPKTISGIEGGIRIPSVPPAASRPSTNFLG